jgi:outer membrane protein OmpA-like peptidoglycan-associated protein/tetratricopeptide (TPR) repeat protein
MTTRFAISILLFLCAFHGYSQNVKKLLKNANSFYEERLYKDAIHAFEEVLKVDPANVEANYKTGVSYLRTIHKVKATPFLEKVYAVNPEYDPRLRFELAQAWHLNHEFEKALKYYKEYKSKIDPKDIEGKKLTERKILECENGIIYKNNPVKAKITNLGAVLNTKFSEFAPVISADESILVFTSRRPGSTGDLLDENQEHYEDIYVSYRKNKVWTQPVNIGRPVNSDEHDASIALSPDGQIVFVYKNDSHGEGDIYYSEFDGVKWSKPEDMGKNINTKYGETSISMTADGRTVYFTSNRPETGFGGMDIYKSTKDKKGRWGPAVNLGATINTSYDDESPFIHPDGKTLYFSSRGHNGMGEYDIFKSYLKDDASWTEPENLGYPINTADDDIYFVLSADNRHGYYSSEREDGLGEKDLYMIGMPEPEKLAVVESKEVTLTKLETKKDLKPIAKVNAFNPVTILKGTVKDALTKEFLASDLEIIDNEKNEVISQIRTNAQTGSFLIVLTSGKNYGIRVNKETYLFHSENFDIPSSQSYQEIYKEVELKKVAVGTRIVLRNIFFDFDKSTLRPESTAELERLIQLMNDVPGLKIEISGHTDNKGTADYNKTLSQSRAKAVVDYLVSKGIKADRLKFAGYGFDRPIADNATDEGRQLNRRTEFEILGN